MAIDVGTGSVRVALVGLDGTIRAIIQREHEQVTPRPGWSEQSASQWWANAEAGIRQIVAEHPDARSRLLAISTCGQMHGTVLVDDDCRPVLDAVPLWNDKRCEAEVRAFSQANDTAALLSLTANPPTTAWPAFKLQWIRRHRPEAWARASGVLMPKDFINARLTGVRATDLSEASCFYLLDAASGRYDDRLLRLFDIERAFLPEVKAATDVIGTVMPDVCRATGLPEGLPVVAGTSDMAASILGSGVYESGTASDSTGTSTLLTVVSSTPRPAPRVNHLHLANSAWGIFTILDSGGDGMRWARQAFHGGAVSYAEIAALAEAAPAGSGGLIFLPYLSGERNAERQNSRAQFFGLTRRHRIGDLHRAVIEGCAFGARRCLDELEAVSGPVSQLIASGGGSRSDFVLTVKASIYGLPIIRTADAENGIVGCAMIGGLGLGAFPDVATAVKRCVRFDKEIEPNPAWQERYGKLFGVFNDLYRLSAPYYDVLDDVEAGPGPNLIP
ncbi:MAG: FGGY family carbohydrate kinase [Ancalomicrobiaceae bacterium]|nr:FGGY family carbohydrate kinase [Ancalomicrobiaceae bacterium]